MLNILKYSLMIICTVILHNLLTRYLFTRENLIFVCLVSFSFALHVYHATRLTPNAISSFVFVCLLATDTSCYWQKGSYASNINYFRCIEYDTMRILAMYSWAAGGLIAITAYGIYRLNKKEKTNAPPNDHVFDSPIWIDNRDTLTSAQEIPFSGHNIDTSNHMKHE